MHVCSVYCIRTTGILCVTYYVILNRYYSPTSLNFFTIFLAVTPNIPHRGSSPIQHGYCFLIRGGKGTHCILFFTFSGENFFLNNFIRFFHRVVANTSPPTDVIASIHFHFWTEEGGEDTRVFQGTSFWAKHFKYLKFFFSQAKLFSYNIVRNL